MHNKKMSFALGSLLLSVALSGCASTTTNKNLPTGEAAYAIIPADVALSEAQAIRPLDILTIRVFGEPELSVDELRVDEAGNIQLPLIGTVSVAGFSPSDLSNRLTILLANKYLVNPQVAAFIKEVAPRYASVEGEVKKPGVYEINKDATLLSTIARAESPSNTAKLSEIVVFRTIQGQRMVARFNLKDIRSGVSPDPAIIDGDVVMVGYSTSRGVMQDVLKAAPLLNVFALINRNN